MKCSIARVSLCSYGDITANIYIAICSKKGSFLSEIRFIYVTKRECRCFENSKHLDYKRVAIKITLFCLLYTLTSPFFISTMAVSKMKR